MKSPYSHNLSLVVALIVGCCLTIVLITLSLIRVGAQSNCVTPQASVNGSLGAWPQSAQVTVVVNATQFS